MSEEQGGKLARLIQPQTFDQAMEMAGKLAASDLVPKAYRNKPANIVIAWEMGAEVGMSPMTALQSIAVIGGKPVMYGEAPLGVVMASGLLEEITEEDKDEVATCTVKRKGWANSVTRTFSMEEARKALVYERDDQGNGKWVFLADRWTYKSWPKDMRKYRARGRALKDAFADVLKGLDIGEAVRDMQGPNGYGTTGGPGEIIEMEKVGSEFMPKQKVAEEKPPVSEPVTPNASAGEAVEARPEPADSGSASTEDGTGSIKKRDRPKKEAQAEVRAPEPGPKVVEVPADAGQSASGSTADTQASGPGTAQAQGPSPVQGSVTSPPAPIPTSGSAGTITWELAGSEHTTKGLTREQFLETVKLCPALNKRDGKGTAQRLLLKLCGVESRNDMTEAQGAAYIAALYEKLPEMKA